MHITLRPKCIFARISGVTRNIYRSYKHTEQKL